MKKFLRKYKHLTSLAAVAVAALLLLPFAGALFVIAAWQLLQIGMSKHHSHRFQLSALSDEQIKEFETATKAAGKFITDHTKLFEGLKDKDLGLEVLQKIPALMSAEAKRIDEMHAEMKKLSKRFLSGTEGKVRWVNGTGYVTDDCANYLGAMAIIRAAQANKIKGGNAEDLISRAQGFLGMEAKAALTASDIPLPVGYASQIAELVYQYGQARQLCTMYPLGMSSVKLPRLKTGEPAFSFFAVSAAITERSPQMEFVTFTPGKAGGIVRIPSEIDADSIIAVGQFVARYIAREMAKLEDLCLFIGDGTATYNNINGIGAQATIDGAAALVVLAAGNTKPTDITLNNMRSLRGTVTGAVLGTAHYYAHPTMEALFVTFNTLNQPLIYVHNADGSASLDGFKVEWVNTMPVYQKTANVGAYQVYFGDLSWWYFGERLAMSVETSREIYFATDEIGIRALERFDIHQMGQASSGALQLAAA